MSQVEWNIGHTPRPVIASPETEPVKVTKRGKKLPIVFINLKRDPKWELRDAERGLAVLNTKGLKRANA